MALLTVQNLSRAGLNTTYAAAAGGGDTFTPSKDTWLHVKNGGGGSIDFWVTSTSTVLNDIGVGDAYTTVPAGQQRMSGPFPASDFGSSGVASISYTGVTSVTVAVIKINHP